MSPGYGSSFAGGPVARRRRGLAVIYKPILSIRYNSLN